METNNNNTDQLTEAVEAGQKLTWSIEFSLQVEQLFKLMSYRCISQEDYVQQSLEAAKKLCKLHEQTIEE